MPPTKYITSNRIYTRNMSPTTYITSNRIYTRNMPPTTYITSNKLESIQESLQYKESWLNK